MTRPRLSLCVLTRDSGSRLANLLIDGRAFSDEIVVGVDATSSDETMDIVSKLADVVFRFEHTGIPEQARLLPLAYATGDWILSLDDDERMDSAFRELRSLLLSDQRYTHYWFPRKWLVQAHPAEYLDAIPWFPDWQLRMFRNDRRLVWCPPVAHQPYAVIGTGCHEDRTAVIHYERLLLDESARERKLAERLGLAGYDRYEVFYGPVEGVRRAALANAPPPVEGRPFMEATGARVVGGIQAANRSLLPPWSAELTASGSLKAERGGRFVTEVRAVNRGGLRWVPPQEGWPRLFLSYHLRDDRGVDLQWDGERTPIGRIVDPGETTRLFATVSAPGKPGDYVIEWDLVSEGECWFAECGSVQARTSLLVSRGARRSQRRSRRLAARISALLHR